MSKRPGNPPKQVTGSGVVPPGNYDFRGLQYWYMEDAPFIAHRPSGKLDKLQTIINFLLYATPYCSVDWSGLPVLPPIDAVRRHLRVMHNIRVSERCVVTARDKVLRIAQRSTYRPKNR
jgi:hypothetical protein